MPALHNLLRAIKHGGKQSTLADFVIFIHFGLFIIC